MGRTHKWIHSTHYRARRDGMKFVRVCVRARLLGLKPKQPGPFLVI